MNWIELELKYLLETVTCIVIKMCHLKHLPNKVQLKVNLYLYEFVNPHASQVSQTWSPNNEFV